MTPEPSGEAPASSIAIKNFTASICVEDKDEVPLYGIEHSEDGKTATCWIESESGKTFGVRWRDSTALVDTSGWVIVDGIKCAGIIGHREKDNGKWKKIDFCDSGSSSRKLVFSDIQTTGKHSVHLSVDIPLTVSIDDDAYFGQSVSEEFGIIKLILRRVEITGTSTYNPDEKRTLDKIHERSKKAMRHQVKLGDELPKPAKCVDTRNHEVLATFIFRYRPKEYLQANDIMPRSKKRKADPSDTIDLTLTDDELSDQDEEIQKLQAKIQAIKDRKRQETNKRVKTEVKQEPISL